MGDGPPGIEQANALAETQLAVQATFFANLDAQAVGFLGVSIALAALDITLRDSIGKLWWLPFLGFIVAALLSTLAMMRMRAQLGPHLPDLGGPDASFSPLAGYNSLRSAIARNTQELGYKRGVLSWTIGLLLASSLISFLLFLATNRQDRPMAVQVEAKPVRPEAQSTPGTLEPEEIEVGLIPLPKVVGNLAFRLFGYPQLAE